MRKAAAIIAEGSGSHFNREVVPAFMAAAEVFRQIALRYADSDKDLEQKAAYVAVARG
jgi:putative two-component system response regulator